MVVHRRWSSVGYTDTTRWYGLKPDGTLARLSSPPEANRDAYSEDHPDVFEPREAHEGDAARAVLYFERCT